MTMKYGLTYYCVLFLIVNITLSTCGNTDNNPTEYDYPTLREVPERDKEKEKDTLIDTKELEDKTREKEPWFAAQRVMRASPFCFPDSEAAENIPPYLCNDATSVEEDENKIDLRRSYQTQPVRQYKDPTTNSKVTRIGPPSQEEFEIGGHFYLGTDKKNRFANPDSVPEDDELIQRKPCRCGQSMYNVMFRIVGGWEVKKHAYPFLVSIQNKALEHFCGGSIINDKYIVTAAHCLEGALPEEIVVQIGDHDISTFTKDKKESPYQQILKVHSIVTHYKYNRKSLDYDISLLRVEGEIAFSRHVGPVCLSNPDEVDMEGSEATVAGWGVTSYGNKDTTNTPRETKVKTMTKDMCIKYSHYAERKLTERMLCANGNNADSCQGDSGGPLTWQRLTTTKSAITIDDVLIGIVSWGTKCGLKTYPGVYTDLTNQELQKWIYENTRIGTYCQ